MRVSHEGRWAAIGVAAMVALVSSTVVAQEDGADHPVVGRYSIESEAGGAVWAFRASGKLIVTGPGDLIARGAWVPALGGEHEFDATVDIVVTGQQLAVLGEASPDAQQVAMLIRATEPADTESGVPWLAESRVIGARLGLVAEPAPSPTPGLLDCERPQWLAEGTVDWDRCDSISSPLEPAVPASPAP